MCIKGSIAVIYLFLVIKVLGKKQISELNIFDYIIGLSLGNIAAEMTVNDEISILTGLLAMTIYGLFSLFVSFITSKSIIARRILVGTPTMLIQRGKILENSLKQARIDINDLLQEARNNGYFDISKIEYAIMEANGKISFLPKSKYASLTPKDMKIKTTYEGICTNLVMDKKIMKKHLKDIGKTEKWLMKRLEKQGYKTLDNILLVTIDSDEKLSIYEKNLDIEEVKPFE